MYLSLYDCDEYRQISLLFTLKSWCQSLPFVIDPQDNDFPFLLVTFITYVTLQLQ